MPLLGIVDGERTVSSLLTAEAWDTLKNDIRAKRRTVTLGCGYPGHAKTSKLGTPYFAHNPGGDGCSAGETAQHLLAKATIVQAAIDAGWDAEPEVRGDGWIADVLATKGSMRVVFEVQWTRQNREDYEFRTNRYTKAGINRTAWFARHTDRLPTADNNLPIFDLAVPDDGDPTVTVGTTTLPLADIVQRLLTGRLRHREYLADGQPASALVETSPMDCWKCHKQFRVWNVTQTTVTGRCGANAFRWRTAGLFPTKRPESEPLARAAAEQLCADRGWTPARIFSRDTKTSGTRYEAFTCPHCNAVCGDMFVQQAFGGYTNRAAVRCAVAATAIHQPHWCLAGDDGVCADPPPSILEQLRRDEANGETDAYTAAAATVTPVNTPGGISINQAVSRMFGGRF